MLVWLQGSEDVVTDSNDAVVVVSHQEQIAEVKVHVLSEHQILSLTGKLSVLVLHSLGDLRLLGIELGLALRELKHSCLESGGRLFSSMKALGVG